MRGRSTEWKIEMEFWKVFEKQNKGQNLPKLMILQVELHTYYKAGSWLCSCLLLCKFLGTTYVNNNLQFALTRTLA